MGTWFLAVALGPQLIALITSSTDALPWGGSVLDFGSSRLIRDCFWRRNHGRIGRSVVGTAPSPRIHVHARPRCLR